ncbi:MAG TPA: DUF4440 domain-containing protein [Candidatus Angelobacter sp.]|nr:DUF4440 domain-containing protein [Candidatus Angelobacter sp.]
MPGLLHAQASIDTGNAEREVRALQRDWMDAMTRGDRAALDRIIGENFTFIHSTGGMEGKKEYIDRAAAGAQLFQRSEITVEGEQLHLYEDRTAVWTSRLTMRNKTDHTETNLQSTNVYVKTNGRWQWVAGQSTRLPTRPEPATINGAVLKTYAGQYSIAAGRSLTVTEDGGTLRAVVTGYRPAELVPKTETEFVWFNPEMNVYSEVVFVRDSSGQVTQAVFQREGVEVWRGKKVK